MFGSIVPVEVSCLTPDTTSNGDWGFPPPPPELLPSFQLLHWRFEITAHVNASPPPLRDLLTSRKHMRKDSSGKPAAATISKATASEPPPSNKYAWQDGEGRLGTAGDLQESRHLGNIPHVRVERRTTKKSEKNMSAVGDIISQPKPLEIFRMPGTTSVNRYYSTTQGVQPFNGSHSPVLILPEGHLTSWDWTHVVLTVSPLSLNRPSRIPRWNTTRNSPVAASAGPHRCAPVPSPPNDDHPNLFCQNNCLALWLMRLPAPNIAAERNPVASRLHPSHSKPSTRAASSTRLKLTCLLPWHACDKDGRKLQLGRRIKNRIGPAAR